MPPVTVVEDLVCNNPSVEEVSSLGGGISGPEGATGGMVSEDFITEGLDLHAIDSDVVNVQGVDGYVPMAAVGGREVPAPDVISPGLRETGGGFEPLGARSVDRGANRCSKAFVKKQRVACSYALG